MRSVLIAALTLSSLCAQQYPDGETLTKQAEASLKKLHSIDYKEESTMETSLGGQTMKMTTEVSSAMVSPGKSRIETKAQGLTMLVVSDGETTWMYSSVGNQYTKKSVAMGAQAIMESMGLGDFMPNMADFHITSKTTGEETVVIDGQKHDCWVVRSDIGAIDLPAAARGGKISGGTMTRWIDKKLGIDLQSDTSIKVSMPGGISTEVHTKGVKKDLHIDAPIPDSTFAFTPPEGATRVDKLSLLGAMSTAPDLAGKPAPDFTLQTVDGKPYGLAAFKGKPVLLDFWTTWCGPCREAMPSVEKVYQEFKDRGLIVLGVDAGEEHEIVADFLKKTPLAYPTVLSGESTILKDYQVKGYPSFVLIGPDSKIADYEVGFGGDEMLRGMLEKVGLSKK
jgi:thiol-disulfide isomerase/thioredoxin